jgi:cobaltochelatase CobT
VNPSPLAFLSYARNDDAHERGRLSELRELLSGEVAAQSGDPFEIFQDKEDISWGQQWQERIKQSLDSVTFLIPILTPRFFRSEACRDELEQFLNRERELNRGDLIMPLYYIDTPILNDPIKRTDGALASLIYSRQYWDWRNLRFESLDSKQVRETIAKMGKEILAALERSSISKPVSSKN